MERFLIWLMAIPGAIGTVGSFAAAHDFAIRNILSGELAWGALCFGWAIATVCVLAMPFVLND